MPFSPPAEEDLPWPEDGADAIDGYVLFAEFAYIGGPELILDEDRHLGVQRGDEAFGVSSCSKREVEDFVSELVVLAQLKSGG